jgi:hypothetical protein
MNNNHAAAKEEEDDDDDDNDDDDDDDVETEHRGMFFSLVLRFDFRVLISERDFMSVEYFSFASYE